MSRNVKCLNLPGTPVTLSLQTAGNPMEEWVTVAYNLFLVDSSGEKHKVTAYEMDTITSDIEAMDTSKLAAIFSYLEVKPEDLIRPSGPVDLLVGVNHASIHPYDDTVPRCDGELKLLRSIFGTGWVIEGHHAMIQAFFHFSSLE